MAVKLTDLADKLKITKLQLKRKLRDLDIKGLNPKKSFFKKEIANKILGELKEDREKKEKEKAIKKRRKKKKEAKKKEEEENVVRIPETITVKSFAGKLNLPVTDVIKELLRNGVSATINERIDFDTASVIGSDFGFKVKKEEEKTVIEDEWKGKKLEERPPVVTVLGHVDHGKTSLLDKVRESDIAKGESGGITQHIGAYQITTKVENKRRDITFIDTPGHKAFSAMRSQGAKVTDIAVLVVAADDSVQPQTKEAVDHIKEAGVPVVVAINKIDLESAQVDKVKKDLTEVGLTPEDLGGTTPVVEVSAKEGTNIGKLLEMIVLTADMQDLKAPKDIRMKGVVIESHLHKESGALATVLVKQGVLNVNDALVAGSIPAKARILENEYQEHIKKAEPSEPVRIVGFEEVPPVGTIVKQADDIKQAREIAEKKKEAERKEGKTSGTGLVEAAKSIKKGEMKELKIVLKADVAGSLQALKESLQALGDEKVGVNIIKAGVGPVNESDIEMATVSNAIVISFRMPTDRAAENLAQQNNIEVSNYDVIYKLIEDIQAALEGMLEPKIVKEETGKAKVLKVFYSSGDRRVVGCKVTTGKVEKNVKVNIKRDDEKIGEGVVKSLKVEEEDKDEIKSRRECGIGIETSEKMKEGDRLEFYRTKKVAQKIDKDKKE